MKRKEKRRKKKEVFLVRLVRFLGAVGAPPVRWLLRLRLQARVHGPLLRVSLVPVLVFLFVASELSH